MDEILKKIVDKRKVTIQKKGIDFGKNIPSKRIVPLILPDVDEGMIVCEIKRGSPSEGRMNDIPDPVNWAGNYIDAGANAVSVLTEEDFFFGSLDDLINIKNKFPGTTILRKDFLLSEEEIDVSYNAGADMVLLITSILEYEVLKAMKEKSEKLGMLPLIEIHNIDELEKILPLKPQLVGINSRDLKTFRIDRNYPRALIERIRKDNIAKNYKTRVIFESGIRNLTDAFFAGSSDFSGVLVGTSIIKSGDLKAKITEIKNGFNQGRSVKNDFFNRIFEKIYFDKKPVVKICGITNIEDAQTAIECGADIIGFIHADSPRKISIDEIRKISSHIGKKALKSVIVVDRYIDEAVNLVREGVVDAIQFHGDQDNDECMKYGVNWYKAIRLKDLSGFENVYHPPFVLYDAFSQKAYGGTGKTIDRNLLDHAKANNIPLFFAGGINPDNVYEIIKIYDPLLIDVSTGIETSPGKKDSNKIKKLFEEIKRSQQ